MFLVPRHYVRRDFLTGVGVERGLGPARPGLTPFICCCTERPAVLAQQQMLAVPQEATANVDGISRVSKQAAQTERCQ